MEKTPQRGRRYAGSISKLGINIDRELHYELKRFALDRRKTLTCVVIGLIEDAVQGGDTRGKQR